MSNLGPEKIPSQPTTSAVISFLSLPIEIRKIIYEKVLMIPSPVYIFQDTGSRLEAFAPEAPYRWLALLYINRQICGEVRAVLYGMNHFSLLEVETKQRRPRILYSFVNCIGSVNASLLSYLCINFPAIEEIEDQSERVKLREDSLQNLHLIQTHFTNLRTLETVMYSQNFTSMIKKNQNNARFIQYGLLEINAQFKKVPYLNRIIVRVYNGPLLPSIKELMQGLGWVVLLSDRN